MKCLRKMLFRFAPTHNVQYMETCTWCGLCRNAVSCWLDAEDALRQSVSGDVHRIGPTVTVAGCLKIRREELETPLSVIYLFNDDVSNSEYIASVVSRISKQLFGKDLEGRGCGII